MPKRTATGRIKTEKDEGIGGQELRTVIRSGRNEKRSRIVKTLDRRDVFCQVLGFKGLAAFSTTGIAGGGAYALNQDVAITAAGTTQNWIPMPLYLLNLTQLSGAGNALLRLHVTSAAHATPNAVKWGTLNGNDNNGASITDWYTQYTAADYPTTNRQPTVHFGRASVKTMIYGAKQRPTRVTLSLVRFTDEDVSPMTDTGVINAGDTNGVHNNFWMAQLRPLLAHPCDQSQAGSTKFPGRMETLKSETFLIDGTTTIESDANVHTRMVAWSHGINKTCEMRQGFSTTFTAADLNNQTRGLNDVQGQFGVGLMPKAKDRVYFMIKAQTFQGSGAFSVNTHNSFDLSALVSNYVNN